jgi:hypothetical protein
MLETTQKARAILQQHPELLDEWRDNQEAPFPDGYVAMNYEVYKGYGFLPTLVVVDSEVQEFNDPPADALDVELKFVDDKLVSLRIADQQFINHAQNMIFPDLKFTKYGNCSGGAALSRE